MSLPTEPYLFLEQQDFLAIMDPNELAAVADEDWHLLAQLERQRISYVQNYLRSRHDVATEFARKGMARNQTLVQCVVDLVLYDLWARASRAGDIPPDRVRRYEHWREWLMDVRDGKMATDLIPAASENQMLPGFAWGSRPPNTHDW